MTQKLLLSACGIILSAGLSAQSITGMSPSSGNLNQTLPIIISGQNTNFNQQGSGTISLFLSQGSFTIGQGSNTGFMNINVLNNTTVSATLNVPGNAALGYYDLWVVGSGSSTLNKTMAFEVMQPSTPSVSVSPSGGQPGSTVNATFTVSGASFKKSSNQIIEKVWLSLGNELITGISNIQVVNSTTFTADVVIPSNTTEGMWDVNVYTDDNTMYTHPASFDIDKEFSRKEFNMLNFEIYPNPVTEVVYATFEGYYDNMDVVIFDMAGKPVSRNDYAVQVQENAVKVNAENLPKGSYMLQFVGNGKVLANKQIVRK